MKKTVLISAVIFLMALVIPLQPASAQEKSKEDKEKEKQMQEIIEAQKKAMAEQKKAQEEMMKALQEKNYDLDELNEIMEEFRLNIDTDDFDGAMRIYTDRSRDLFRGREPYIVTTPSTGISVWTPYGFGDTETTTWEFSKSVKEKSFTNNYSFDVESSVNTVSMSVSGDCESGEIRIVIIKPDGETYSDITIDEFGNLNWRKSFKVSEDENQDKTGEWEFEIDATDATGYFKISLRAY